MTAFDYFGESFEFSPEVDPFAITEFAEAMDDDVDSEGLRGIAVAWRLALSCVAEDDRKRFRSVSRKNKAKVIDYLAVFRDWTAEATERPTGLPTDSSDGPTLTVVNSGSQPEPEVSTEPTVRADMRLAVSRSA
jgi:hypothetical protein